MKSRNFLVAVSKVSQFSDTEQWCGCLTPSEAVELIDAGGIAVSYYENKMREYKAKGDSKPSWFYFIPSKDLKKILMKKKKV